MSNSYKIENKMKKNPYSSKDIGSRYARSKRYFLNGVVTSQAYISTIRLRKGIEAIKMTENDFYV